MNAAQKVSVNCDFLWRSQSQNEQRRTSRIMDAHATRLIDRDLFLYLSYDSQKFYVQNIRIDVHCGVYECEVNAYILKLSNNTMTLEGFVDINTISVFWSGVNFWHIPSSVLGHYLVSKVSRSISPVENNESNFF